MIHLVQDLTESTGELRSAGISGAGIQQDLDNVDPRSRTGEEPSVVSPNRWHRHSTPTSDQTGGTGGQTPTT